MSTLLPQVVPLTSDEIRNVQTLTLFDISAEFLAFIIAANRLDGKYTPTQRKGFRRQLEQLIYPVRNQLQASSPTGQTAEELVEWLIFSWPEQELDALVKHGLWYDEVHTEENNYRSHLARYHNEEALFEEWRDSKEYLELYDPDHNPDPIPPARGRFASVMDARRREQILRTKIGHNMMDKYGYALSVVKGWWGSSVANAPPVGAAAPTMTSATVPAPLTTTVAASAGPPQPQPLAHTTSAATGVTVPTATTPAESGSSVQNT